MSVAQPHDLLDCWLTARSEGGVLLVVVVASACVMVTLIRLKDESYTPMAFARATPLDTYASFSSFPIFLGLESHSHLCREKKWW